MLARIAIVLVSSLLFSLSEGIPLRRQRHSSNTLKIEDPRNGNRGKYRMDEFALRERKLEPREKRGAFEDSRTQRISHQNTSLPRSFDRIAELKKAREKQAGKEHAIRVSNERSTHLARLHGIKHRSIRDSFLKAKKKHEIGSGKRSQIDDENALVITGDDDDSDLSHSSENDRQFAETGQSPDTGVNSILPYPGGFPPGAGPTPSTGGRIVVIQPEENHQPENTPEVENVPTENTMCNIQACSDQNHACKCLLSGHGGDGEETHEVPNSDITIVLKGMNTNLMMRGFLPILKYWYLLYLNALQGKIQDSNLKQLGVNLANPSCSEGLMKIFKNGLAESKGFAGILKLHTESGDTKTELITRSQTSAENRQN